jgi:hypothetical protein
MTNHKNKPEKLFISIYSQRTHQADKKLRVVASLHIDNHDHHRPTGHRHHQKQTEWKINSWFVIHHANPERMVSQ